jgi:FkbM family methyltransferase
MKSKIVAHEGFLIEYFENDCLAKSSIEVGKRWEPHILDFIRFYRQVIGIKNIIDIGANFGYHTLFFSREVEREGGIVFSFEPQIQNYTLLYRNIQHNLVKNVQIIQQACSDKLEVVFLPLFNPEAHQMINMGDLTPLQSSWPGAQIATSIPIDSLPLPPIDVIKVDVQGWELGALRGAKNLIERDRPLLIVEFEEHQLRKTGNTCSGLAALLRTLGYQIFFLDYQYPSDHICVHVSKVGKFREVFHKHIKDHSELNSVNRNIEYGVTEKLSF